MSTQRDHVTPPVTYQQLFEKYATLVQHRNIVTIVSGALALIGVAASVASLRELRRDRAAVQAAPASRTARLGKAGSR
jgi:hypothetical protein